MKPFTKENVTQVLIDIQDRGDLTANAIATKAVNDFSLESVHCRLTGNAPESYKVKITPLPQGNNSKTNQLLKELYEAITTEDDMEVLNAVLANVAKHLKSIEKK